MCSPSSIYEKSSSCGHGYGPGPGQPPFFHSLMGGRSDHLDICYALRCDCYVIIRSLKTMQFYHYVGGDLFIVAFVLNYFNIIAIFSNLRLTIHTEKTNRYIINIRSHLFERLIHFSTILLNMNFFPQTHR